MRQGDNRSFVAILSAFATLLLGCSEVQLYTTFVPEAPGTSDRVPVYFDPTQDLGDAEVTDFAASVSVTTGVGSTVAWGPPFIPAVPLFLWQPPPDPPGVSVVYHFELRSSGGTLDLSNAGIRTASGQSTSPASLNTCEGTALSGTLVSLPRGSCSVHAHYDLLLADDRLEVLTGILIIGQHTFVNTPLRYRRTSHLSYEPFVVLR